MKDVKGNENNRIKSKKKTYLKSKFNIKKNISGIAMGIQSVI